MKKERKKRSIVWSISSEEFKKLVNNSTTIAQICRYFGLGRKGGNYGTIKRRLKSENVDISHFKLNPPQKFNWISKEEFLSKIQSYKDNNWIKKKIIEFDILKQECSECKLSAIWNNKPLVLHLDHINGNRNDNRLDNLRFLCPNCHTQTETYSMGQRKEIKYHCIHCKKIISKHQIQCKQCGDEKRRKIKWPLKEELEKLVNTIPMTKIGKQFGVSDNAIRKWCKSYNIEYKVGRGHWS